jgi:hypothetical protein
MTPAQVAAQLHATIDEAVQLFLQVDDTRTTCRPDCGGWCPREILGHLIDSACNNHRRFIVGQSPATRQFDGYDQDEWVRLQSYNKIPWRDVVTLWLAYNRHLAHVMNCTSEEAAAHSALSPDGQKQVTVLFLMEDYVVHLRHHLARIRTMLLAAPPLPQQ